MLHRCFLLTLTVSFCAILSGCLLDAGPYPADGGGGTTSTNTGGSVGGGGTTTTTSSDTTGGTGGTMTTGGTTSTGGTGGTTTVAECTIPEDCTDMGVCWTRDCVNQMCTQTPVSSGTLVSDADSTDCVKEVCNGSGGTTFGPDDDDIPVPDGSECHIRICQSGTVAISPVNEDGACFAQLTDPCQENSTCQSGDCVINDYPDGDYSFGMCGTATCMGGQLISTSLDDAACGPDPNTTNCIAPDCKADGSCGTKNEPMGKVCDKGQMPPANDGTCDGAGNCL